MNLSEIIEMIINGNLILCTEDGVMKYFSDAEQQGNTLILYESEASYVDGEDW